MRTDSQMPFPHTIRQITARDVGGFLMGKPDNWPCYLPMRYPADRMLELAYGMGWRRFEWTGTRYERAV